jgi:hypothetical protein
MRANLTASLFLVAVTLLSGCKPSVDAPRIDASSKDVIMASVTLMSHGMSKKEEEQLWYNFIVVMKDAAVGPTDKYGKPLHDENRPPEFVQSALDGMTVDTLAKKADEIRAQRAR